jgi:hypothetical protein
MAGLNVNKWQAARRKSFYDPVMQFYLRMIRTAFDEAKSVGKLEQPFPAPFPRYEPGEKWDSAIMARAWIARETPDRHEDRAGYLLSFEHCCEVLGLDADFEATWMLRQIDQCADFDTGEVHARVVWLTDNPPDEVEDEKFTGMRVVPSVDQMTMFRGFAA